MTQNQIALRQAIETERTNRVKESETERHNREDEYAKLLRGVGNTYGLAYHLASGKANFSDLIKQLKSLYGATEDDISNLLSSVDKTFQNSGDIVSEGYNYVKDSISAATGNSPSPYGGNPYIKGPIMPEGDKQDSAQRKYN